MPLNAPMAIGWKLGVETELLAPRGLTRQDLADRLARDCGGTVRRIFHAQAEPSLVPGAPIFETLMLGFAVTDAQGRPLAKLIDDLTLQDDFDRKAAPAPGWYRIASDDVRLLRLIERHCDPQAPIETVLDPARDLFGGTVETKPGGIRRLSDPEGAPICLAAPLPGERGRACEIVTAPMEDDQFARLDALLAPARELGFLLPAEGAVHIHFDGAPLCNARVLQRLVRFLEAERAALRGFARTNPCCRRLGAYAPEVLDVLFAADFADLDWAEARGRLAAAKPTKYCDFNLLNLVTGRADKHTFEVRILGPSLSTEEIIAWAARFADILKKAVDG